MSSFSVVFGLRMASVPQEVAWIMDICLPFAPCYTYLCLSHVFISNLINIKEGARGGLKNTICNMTTSPLNHEYIFWSHNCYVFCGGSGIGSISCTQLRWKSLGNLFCLKTDRVYCKHIKLAHMRTHARAYAHTRTPPSLFRSLPFDGSLAPNCDTVNVPFRRVAGDQSWSVAGSFK